MERSARALGLAFERARARRALDDAAAGTFSAHRVRLTLDEAGRFAATAQPLTGENDRVWTYAVSPVRLPASDALARHKTTWRAVYDEEQARAARETGADEVIFLNERNEVIEGSRTNMFARIGGRLVTPPLSAGALDGCLRRALLDDPQSGCVEGRLTLDDLTKAAAVYLGNSLRGLIRAVPAEKTCPPLTADETKSAAE
jgi:para-aminobenzoate synthetase/4-amino-4-deoxychorismate lyase